MGTDDPAALEAVAAQAIARLADPAALEGVAAQAITRLAEVADPAAFQALQRLSALTGVKLGESARALAASGSWARVAEAAGTSRQAAWARWNG